LQETLLKLELESYLENEGRNPSIESRAVEEVLTSNSNLAAIELVR
jgi:hypothetical protein